MGQARIRKLRGEYPEQTEKPVRLNSQDVGQAFALLYQDLFQSLRRDFPENSALADLEEQAAGALLRMMELAEERRFPPYDALVCMVSWYDRKGTWWRLSVPEKKALALILWERSRKTEVWRKATDAYFERAKMRVAQDAVFFEPGATWSIVK